MSKPSSRRPFSEALIRPLVRRLRAYAPGEQPRVKGLIKLNTNENPYPPSPKVYQAISDNLNGRLRLYPDPRARQLRQQLAKRHDCREAQVIIGNGSDDLLALATRAFVEPSSGTKNPSKATIQYFTPSYSLYPVLTDIHGAAANPVPLTSDFGMPSVAELKKKGFWDFRAALTFITTPNAPSGRAYAPSELERMCRAQQGVVILDEAYVDFAKESALNLASRYPHVIVSRTFSKSYSLCALRIGYFIGPPALIAALDKIRDSYNVNGLGQVAALAALRDRAYHRACLRRIVATRARLHDALQALGFEVLPSQTNFLMTRPPVWPAQAWLERLRAKKILVRWWPQPEVRDYLRITIGTEEETDKLLRVIESILTRASSRGK